MSEPGRSPTLLLRLTPLILWSCCSSEETRMYHLAPERPAGSQSAGGSDLRLLVGPVQIPGYLDRPQLVSRLNRNELQLSELDYWAEPLSRNLEAVLAENLLAATGAREVRRPPEIRPGGVDCRLDVQILRFEGQRDGLCHLTAEWSLSGEALGTERVQRRSVLQGAASGEGLAGVVGGLNRLLNRLSVEIAEEIVRRVAGDRSG